MIRRVALFAALAVVLGGAIWWGLAGSRSALVVTEVCDAAQARDHARAVAVTADGVVDADRATYNECACASLVELGRAEACAALVDRHGSAVPALPSVADALFGVYTARRDPVRIREAARAAVESVDRPPEEWVVRAVLADPSIDKDYWRAQARRSVVVAVLVSIVARGAGDDAFGNEVLGTVPPADPADYGPWRAERARILAFLNDEAGGLALIEDSVRRGVPRAVGEADFAMAMLTAMRQTPRVNDALLSAWQHRDELSEELRPMLASRFMQALVVRGELEALAKVVDICRAEGISSQFNQAQVRSLDIRNHDRVGSLEITSDIDGVLFVAPDDKRPVDTPYEQIPVKAGVKVLFQRSVSDHPVRYVLRDTDNHVRAAAQAWLIPERVQQFAIEAKAAWPVQAAPTRPQPADGVRRVVALVVDSGDWRYLRYGFATGQLPMMQDLVEASPTGVLISDPPSTSAAMLRLTEPSPRPKDTPLRLRRLGSQYQAALGLDENPLSGLRLLSQSATPSLTDVIAAKKRVLNMLNGHGAISAGTAGISGPEGLSPIILHGRRSLEPRDELSTEYSKSLLYREQFESAAAQFDDLVGFVGSRAADLYLYRYDPTDVLAHNHLPSWSNTGPVAPRSMFFDGYLYFDLRLRDLVAAMDADDVLLVLSDHGTQNSANHDKRSLFIVSAPGLAVTSVADVRIEHIPSYLATALCVDDPWNNPVAAAALPSGCLP